MEIKGRIIYVSPLASGTSNTGKQWSKQEYVLETVEQYPKKVHFSMFNDNIVQFMEGQSVVIQANIESREFNGKWYTQVTAWRAELDRQPQGGIVTPQPQSITPQPHSSAPAQQAPLNPPSEQQQLEDAFMKQAKPEGDDLPFL